MKVLMQNSLCATRFIIGSVQWFFHVIVGPGKAKFNYFSAGLYWNSTFQMNVVEVNLSNFCEL